MTEQKLPIPRMVEVWDRGAKKWEQRELLADLRDLGLLHPYICRNPYNEEDSTGWQQMREIPQPKTRPMTPRELLDAIRGGAVWRNGYGAQNYVARTNWDSAINISSIVLCYDWHGDESDVWVKAEVTE